MRRYIRALLLCTVFAVISGLYVYNKLLCWDLPGHRMRSGAATPGAAGDSREVGAKTRPAAPHWSNRYGAFLNISYSSLLWLQTCILNCILLLSRRRDVQECGAVK